MLSALKTLEPTIRSSSNTSIMGATFLSLVLLCSMQLMGMTKPGTLPVDDFAQRRAIFTEELRTLNAMAVLHSAPELERNNDVAYPYRQNSDFIYLTNWPARNAILVITPREKGSDQPVVTLFVEPRDSKREVWTGPQAGIRDAESMEAIDQALPYPAFWEHLKALSADYDRCVFSHGNDSEFEAAFLKAREDLKHAPPILQSVSSVLTPQRMIKSAGEIQSLEKAILITGESLHDAFAKIPNLNYEYEVKAEIEYGFMKRGASRLGFPSIVGAGKNTTYLHYEAQSGVLYPDDLLLLDVGAEWNYYSADISRTVPVDGHFTDAQKLIYDLVLQAQDGAIAVIKPGVSWRKPHEKAIEILTTGLVELQLLSGDIDSLITEQSYKRFFMHGTSHWLGLDVHDTGGYVNAQKKTHRLRPGMVLTVEPGLYITQADDIDPKWWNIGIRIEDDVLVTQDGHRVLSADIPKTIAQIEAVMQP